MKKLYVILVLSFGILFLSGIPVHAKRMIAVGVPVIQARSSIEITHNVTLDNNQKVKNRLLIAKDKDKYIWVTRDHRELIFKKMKWFDLFIDPATGGYVKVIRQSDGRFAYMEHISHKDFKGFTYWGIMNVYEP